VVVTSEDGAAAATAEAMLAALTKWCVCFCMDAWHRLMDCLSPLSIHLPSEQERGQREERRAALVVSALAGGRMDGLLTRRPSCQF
jgi:hypothetical protein